jgi:hypothetical protein
MPSFIVLAGILGPIVFAVVVTWLTFAQYGFLLSLGWDPLLDPTHDWPSGLSLGPYGGWMIATFLFSGLCLFLLALGLRRRLAPGFAARLASLLLAIAGLALAGEAFLTDPTNQQSPHTWHGILHDLFFVVLGLSLMPGMLVLGAAFRGDSRWRGFAGYTWITAALALPAFFLKGAAFYFFLGAILLWSEGFAWKLRSMQ